jgi:hypothetical protein
MRRILHKKLVAHAVETSLQHEFTLCWISSNRDTSPKPEKVTLATLAARFRVPEVNRGRLSLAEYLALDKTDREQKKIRDAEKNGKAFIPVEFNTPNVRKDAAVASIHAFVLDFDGGVTKAEIEAKLAGLAYLAHTSYSHHAGEDRWRVLIPYSAPCTPDKHVLVFTHFKHMFDGRLDPRSETKNQLWYTPACPHDAADQYQLLVHGGTLFDPHGIAELQSTLSNHLEDHAIALMQIGNEASVLSLPVRELSEDDKKRLASALAYIAADDRSVWIRVGMALKQEYGDPSLEIWLDWSAKSDKFDPEDARYNWNSFKEREAGVTLGTLFFLAKQGGWSPEGDLAAMMAVAEISETHFVSREGGKTIVFREAWEPGTSAVRLQRLTTKDIIDYYANRTITVGKKQIGLGSYWLGHADRRQYTDVIFSPNADIPGTYNLWRGFSVEPRAGDWSLTKAHIKEVICAGNQDQYDYAIGWMAYAVQHPERPAEVALVMRGLQGTGKGVLARTFGRLFGQHFLHISQSRHLTGHFNAHLSDCVVLFADEAFWAGDKQSEGALKALITEPRLMIEPKGVNAYWAENRLHILIASNSDWVVPAGNKERRYCVFDVADTHIQDLAYFAALNAEIENGGMEAMLHELQNYDLAGFDIRKPPYTDGLRTQMLQTLSSQQQWWLEVLQKGELWGTPPKGSDSPPNSVGRDELQFAYASDCKGVHVTKSSATQLGIFLKSVLPKGWPEDVKKSSISKARLYVFPPLDQCREYFERLTGLQGLFDEPNMVVVPANLHNLDNVKTRLRRVNSA